jgi:Ni/Co efflux regulator RcnB
MKTLLSALLALTVLAGVAGSAAQAAEFGSVEYWVERSANMN